MVSHRLFVVPKSIVRSRRIQFLFDKSSGKDYGTFQERFIDERLDDDNRHNYRAYIQGPERRIAFRQHKMQGEQIRYQVRKITDFLFPVKGDL